MPEKILYANYDPDPRRPHLFRGGIQFPAYNRWVITLDHPQYKGAVLARYQDGGTTATKLLRFGHWAYPSNHTAAARKAFKARHRANIRKGKGSRAYWADRALWAGPGGFTVVP